jgi:similar to phage protein
MNGKIYDSKFEAQVAAELEIEKNLGQIKDYDTQYRIEGWVYDENGNPAFPYRHKVDFRIHNLDGSFTLREAKGVETDDYKWRRKILEKVWLPAHPEYTYEVVYQKSSKRYKRKGASR